MTKQELKHDEMADVGERIGAWYHKHDKVVQVLVLLVLVGIIGYRVYGKFHADTLARATGDYTKAVAALNSALAETDEAKRKELYATAITEAEQVTKDHSGLYVGRQAQLLLGNAYYYLSAAIATQRTDAADNLKRAREAYERYIAIASTPEERAAGKLALGHALENQMFTSKDVNLSNQAADAYKDVEKLAPNSFLAAEAKLSLGRMYFGVTDKQDEAKKLFEQVAASRKLAEPETPDAKAKPVKDESGEEITPAKMNEVREYASLSYAKEAEQALTALKGYEPAKK